MAPEAARLGALQVLAALSGAHGTSLASSAMESVALAVKFTARCMPCCPLEAHVMVVWVHSGIRSNIAVHMSCKPLLACDRLVPSTALSAARPER